MARSVCPLGALPGRWRPTVVDVLALPINPDMEFERTGVCLNVRVLYSYIYIYMYLCVCMSFNYKESSLFLSVL